jgi:hypothetical protein
LTTTNKDFKVKHGLAVSGGATFGQAIEIGEPTAADHAASKGYVDAAILGFVIDPVGCATTANINISTDTIVGDIIDGITLEANTRILIKNQTTASQNGIYVVNSSGPATRALDYNANDQIRTGDQIYVRSGSVNGESYWSLSSNTIVVGTQPLTFNLLGPTKPGTGLLIENNLLEVDQDFVATIAVDEFNVKNLSGDILGSSLTSVGTLESLNVTGSADFGENLYLDGSLQVAGDISAPEGETLSFVGDLDITGNLEITMDLNVLGNLDVTTDLNVTENLGVSGNSVFSGDFDVSGVSTFSGNALFEAEISVPAPTLSSHATTKDYVDNLLNQSSVEITTIDDLSNYFNGYNSRFLPTYQGFPVTLQNPFNLLLTIDGIIQSVGSPDYVWQSVMPRVGFRIDNDGYIAFPEAIPVGSSFDARVLVGSATTTQTKVYPFKAMDIVLGGY